MKKLRPYQDILKSDILDAWNSGHRNVLAVSSTGSGKCLGKGTPVLMFNGDIKKVEDIVGGDLLMGPDSKPRKVLNTCKGVSKLYNVTPIKGDSWVCNDAHVLSLRHTVTKEIVDIDVQEYLSKNESFKHLYKQFRVGVDFPLKPFDFDPYLAGLYLAEGAHANSLITTPEPEVIQYIEEWCRNNKHKVNIAQGSNCKEIGISSFDRRHYKNKISTFRKNYTSKATRRIPRDLLINSRSVRLELLAGLLDGDGYLHSNCFEIITKHEELKNDILFLARSLGFAAYSTLKIGTIKELNFSGTYHRISISGDTHLIPNKVPRKKASPRQQKKDVTQTGFTVSKNGIGEYYGFTIDGDGRFLLGDFTVTHNTVTFCSTTIDLAVSEYIADIVKSIRSKVLGLDKKLPTVIIAHRKELVQQICITLAEEGIEHNVIAPTSVIKGIIAAERRMTGKQFYNYNANVTVASVDTLNSRIKKHLAWADKIRLWIIDEAAHVLAKNKWGKSTTYFPNAIGLGVTATPERLDGRGLGRECGDGLFDIMVEGPPTRYFIEQGYLSKYKVARPVSDYQLYLKQASSGADYTREALEDAAMKSHIVGDVVDAYKKFAYGKQNILFAPGSISGREMENRFNEAGIPAKLLTAETPDQERLEALIDFRNKKIKVLINVDLFDEGLDVPGIEVVQMARATMSLSKYLQQCGRGLRPVYAPGFDLETQAGRLAAQAKGPKPYALIIDHVGNVKTHGLPDNYRNWTLERTVKRRDKVNLIRLCQNIDCGAPYDRLLDACPHCGQEPIPMMSRDGGGRPGPKEVDGDLVLLDPETLRALEQEANLEDPLDIYSRVSHVAGTNAGKNQMQKQKERLETQRLLASTIADWAGYQRWRGLSDRQIHKQFYVYYDMTITQALSQKKAEMLVTIGELQSELRNVPSSKRGRT